MSKILCVIPARYSSTRLPAKALIPICGKPLIMWVYEAACAAQAFSQVVVATDDLRIQRVVEQSGGTAILTSEHHQSGTDRIGEVVKKIPCDYVVNLQGDEPEVDPGFLCDFAQNLKKIDNNSLLTAVARGTIENKSNPSVVKVVLNSNSEALYFSRSGIPYSQSGDELLPYIHTGIYGFTGEGVAQFCAFKRGVLESVESLEQLRALENSMRVVCMQHAYIAHGIDTPQDLLAFRVRMNDPELSLVPVV